MPRIDEENCADGMVPMVHKDQTKLENVEAKYENLSEAANMKRNCSKLLIFCIGSARAPATGFANFMGYNGAQARFTIERDDRGIERPPTAAIAL